MLLKGPAVTSISLALAALVANAVPVRFSPRQDAVTGPVKWDNYTIFVNNERLFLFSGEFHVCHLHNNFKQDFSKLISSVCYIT